MEFREPTTLLLWDDHFDRLISESVDQGLTCLVGQRGKQVVYGCLQKRQSIAKEQIPGKLNDFSAALEKMFGKSSQVTGRVLAERLYYRLGLEFVEKSNYQFLDYVKDARLSTPVLLPE